MRPRSWPARIFGPASKTSASPISLVISASLPQAEWGGYKQSGVGRELGEHGLAEYRETKHVWHNIRPAVQHWFDGESDGESDGDSERGGA